MRVAVAMGVLVGVCGFWAYTGVRTWEGDVAVEAASVGRLVDS